MLQKDSDRVNAYGTIDELNTSVGYTISKMDPEDELRRIVSVTKLFV